jgi:ABC-type nitrate/sulfonate/bicarbonate transport system substrate-binding protein
LPFVLLGLVALAAVWPLLKPAPPKRVVIATGPEGSSYNEFAAEYARFFAEHGITLAIRKTEGSRENYLLLNDPHSGVDAALVQGGTAPPLDQLDDLVAMCAVSFEPLFILFRPQAFGGEPLERLDQLRGKRLAVGKETGGTYWLSTPLLALHGIGTSQDKATTIVHLSGAGSIKKLQAGEIDAGFYSVSADTPYIAEALQTPGIEIMSLKLAPAYADRFAFCTLVTLHEGMVDLPHDLPSHDVAMIAPTTALIARKDTHPAIVELLVHAAQKVHARRDPLVPAGAFPSLDYTELPISSDARYHFNNKPGILQRNLPFWLASLIDRLLILIVPLAVVMIPVLRLAPRLYQWRMQSRVYRWYKRIRRLDGRMLEASDPEELADVRADAQRLEREIAEHTKVPLAYMGHFYAMRTHLGYLREQFATRGVDGSASANASTTTVASTATTPASP